MNEQVLKEEAARVDLLAESLFVATMSGALKQPALSVASRCYEVAACFIVARRGFHEGLTEGLAEIQAEEAAKDA
jgi:hypothetical protein